MPELQRLDLFGIILELLRLPCDGIHQRLVDLLQVHLPLQSIMQLNPQYFRLFLHY